MPTPAAAPTVWLGEPTIAAFSFVEELMETEVPNPSAAAASLAVTSDAWVQVTPLCVNR